MYNSLLRPSTPGVKSLGTSVPAITLPFWLTKIKFNVQLPVMV